MKQRALPEAVVKMLREAAAKAPAAPVQRPDIAPMMSLKPINLIGSQYELIIYGDIGESWYGTSVLAADVVKQLNELPPTVAQINVRINSYGGSVSDGLAIYNALKRMAATKVVTVDGVAMSIASLIAMCGDTIEMPEPSLFMIHAPWGMAVGNSNDMREFADFLDVYAEAMAGAYVGKSGQTRDVIMGLLTDGKDHTYTAAQALEMGFCDVLINSAAEQETPAEETTPDEETETATAAFLSGMQRFTARSPSMVGAISAAVRHSHLFSASGTASAQPATTATLGENVMSTVPAAAAVPAATIPPAAAPAPADTAAIVARAQSDLRHRNDAIVARLKPHMAHPAIASLQTEALTDPSMTLDQIGARALDIMAAQATPNSPIIVAGVDQRDKIRDQATNFLLVRAGGIGMLPAAIAAARQDNQFNGMNLLAMARHCCVLAGLNPSGWSKERIVASAITHSESDFPNIFQNVLHKTLLNSYLSVEATWREFCKIGELSDFRPHNRYYMGGFSDLVDVQENGEYADGTFGDAEKESITGKSKGRILNLSYQMIVDDDMSVFVQAAQKLGQAGGRTIEKDVYALLALNSGAGPTMSDGKALFHVDHLNISGTPAVVSTDSFDDMRVGMGSQLDPSGNDYLSVAPAAWVGPLKYKGAADVVNGSKFDTSVSSKFEIPNKSFGLVKKAVGTPRLSGTAWFGFADPNVEPAIEVAFLDGVQEPQVQMEESFRSNGISWRVKHDYGVAGVGYRGAWKNAGA